jgi:hypothetical protein
MRFTAVRRIRRPSRYFTPTHIRDAKRGIEILPRHANHGG